MYPLFWTNQKGGIFMRYSYEFKRKCVELYHEGKWPETPPGIKDEKNFHDMIVRWSRTEDAVGSEALRHKNRNRQWTPEEKLEIVHKVLAGNSTASVAIGEGLNPGLVYAWVRKYQMLGYNGLIHKKKGRPPKNTDMDKTTNVPQRKLAESEYEELVRLRAEVEYYKAENEVIKKEIALREEKQAARLKAKKQQSSKNFGKKDTN